MVQVRELDHIGGGCVGPLLQAVVRKLVHDHVVVLLDQGLDDAEPSEPARRVDEQGLDVPEVRQLFFKLHIVPTCKIQNTWWLRMPEGSRPS